MVCHHIYTQYADGVIDAALWMGINIDEGIGSTGGEHKGYMDVGAPLRSRAITDADYHHVISATGHLASGQDDVSGRFIEITFSEKIYSHLYVIFH